MMNSQAFRLAILTVLLVITSDAATFEWDAAWGWYPNTLEPGMALFGVAPSTSPVLDNGSLHITTLAPAENMGYICTGNNFVAPSTLILEAQVRVLTNSSLQSYRSACVVGFTLAPNIGNTLFIGKDEIFLGNGHASRGPPVPLDTDDAFLEQVQLFGAGPAEGSGRETGAFARQA